MIEDDFFDIIKYLFFGIILLVFSSIINILDIFKDFEIFFVYFIIFQIFGILLTILSIFKFTYYLLGNNYYDNTLKIQLFGYDGLTKELFEKLNNDILIPLDDINNMLDINNFDNNFMVLLIDQNIDGKLINYDLVDKKALKNKLDHIKELNKTFLDAMLKDINRIKEEAEKEEYIVQKCIEEYEEHKDTLIDFVNTYKNQVKNVYLEEIKNQLDLYNAKKDLFTGTDMHLFDCCEEINTLNNNVDRLEKKYQ